MVSPVIQEELNALMQSLGRGALADPVIFESLLRDRIGEDSRDANLLIAALKSGIPQAIANGSTSGATLAHKMRDERLVSDTTAESAVKAWALALGAVVTFDEIVAEEKPHALPPVEVVVQESPILHSSQPAKPQGIGRYLGLFFVIVVLIAGIAGYGLGNKSDKPKIITQTVTKPAPVSSAPTDKSVNAKDRLPGNIHINLPPGEPQRMPTSPAPTSVAPTTTDAMLAYNAKLVEVRRQFDTASGSLTTQVNALASESDPNTMLDTAGTAYGDFGTTLARLTADLEGASPPAEVAAIHRLMTSNMRELAAMVGDVAQAARDHDGTLFADDKAKMEAFVKSAGDQQSALISAAGYDADQFATTGVLVKRQP